MTITDIASVSISEAARATGVPASTLRYYEGAGLMLSSVDRASSRHRRYTTADVTWVMFLTKLRSTAMPISRIREYVELARRGESTSAARLRLLEQHRTAVLAQVEEMTKSLAAIDFKIATYKERI